MTAGVDLGVGDVGEADNALIFQRNERYGSRDFLLRSDAEFLVLLPVGCLVILGAVAGYDATGAGVRGRDFAAGKGTGWSGVCERRRFGRGLARFHFWGCSVCVEGVEVLRC